MSDPKYMDITPARPPPKGQVSNFIDPVSRAYEMEIVIGVAIALITISMLLRTYCRLKISHGFGTEDWLCLVATVRHLKDHAWSLILNLAYCGILLKICHEPGGGPVGIHLWDVSLAVYQQFFKDSLAQFVLNRICSAFIKVAFMIFYLRLFRPFPHVRVMVRIGMGVVIVFCVASIIIDVVACSPWPGEHGGWADRSMDLRCGRVAPDLLIAAAYISVITDFYLLFIPLHLVPKLKLSTRRKLGLSLIFLTGLLATGAGVANIVVRSDKRQYHMSDFTWTFIPEQITALIELNLGLVCYSMPVVCGYFAGRITNLSKSLGSWVQERRARRAGSMNSSANDANVDRKDKAGSVSQPLPHPMTTATLTGVRKFIHNVYRSGARSSARDTAAVTTYNEPATPVVDYHEHLRAQNRRPTLNDACEQV